MRFNKILRVKTADNTAAEYLLYFNYTYTVISLYRAVVGNGYTRAVNLLCARFIESLGALAES